jgi:hypothetical protein
MKTQNNYRVPGTKMTSRFGYSHNHQRAESRHLSKLGSFGPETGRRYTPLRRLKTCQHPAKYWQDESWGGPESGGEAGHCKFCGWSFRHVMY